MYFISINKQYVLFVRISLMVKEKNVSVNQLLELPALPTIPDKASTTLDLSLISTKCRTGPEKLGEVATPSS